MSRPGFLLAASALIALSLLLSRLVPAQVEGHVFPSGAFEETRRPAVPFDHDAHNTAAGLDDCSACHHLYENGRIVPGADSVGIPCSDCHPVRREEGRTPLLVAYHTQCKECHFARKKGPVTCGPCHPRR
jgi:hypothetical protein